ncbi:MAG: signal peptidase I [Candidatus Omnitrophica bacterium]|nr:signal peptidase I [Candidatus Omnitrophota bacterium]
MIYRKYSWDWWWYEWVKPVLVAGVLALFIRTFIIQPFKIPSHSMFPTLKPGDRIFVNKFVYGAKIPFTHIKLPELEDPVSGDIVVFKSPVEKKKFLIKRYIAGPGDTVMIQNGKVYVNGKVLDSVPFNRFYYYGKGEYGEEGKEIHVPEGEFYVLGDNSANSLDSRYWGFTPVDNMVGKAFVIHWPITRIRLLKGGD